MGREELQPNHSIVWHGVIGGIIVSAIEAIVNYFVDDMLAMLENCYNREL